MRTVRALAPGVASSLVGATLVLGCSSTEYLGDRPVADASPDDDARTVTGADAGAAPDASAPETGVGSDGGPSAARIVLFGGTDGVSFDDDTWTFDGTEWTLLNISGPPARSGMISATLGGKMVVYGGSAGTAADGGSTVYGDTWTFDGAAWTELSPASSPGPRSGSGVAVIDGALYIYGGGTSGSARTDTWKFDGATWTQVTTIGPTGPTPTRDAFAMSAMAGGHSAIFFGGDTSTGSFQNDTWTFDGTNWTQVTTATSPSVRALAVLVPWSGGALQWGGNTGVGPNDTWTFDGTNWTQLTVSPPGGATDGPCGASAAVLGSEVVLFGGYCSSPADTTYVFDGSSWSLLDFTSHPVVPGPRVGAAMATLP